MNKEMLTGISFVLIAIVLFFISGFLLMAMIAISNLGLIGERLGVLGIGWVFTIVSILAAIFSLITGIFSIRKK